MIREQSQNVTGFCRSFRGHLNLKTKYEHKPQQMNLNISILDACYIRKTITLLNTRVQHEKLINFNFIKFISATQLKKLKTKS